MFFDVLVMLWNSRIEVKSNILTERVVKSDTSQLRAWGETQHSDREGCEKVLLRNSRLEVESSILTKRAVKK